MANTHHKSWVPSRSIVLCLIHLATLQGLSSLSNDPPEDETQRSFEIHHVRHFEQVHYDVFDLNRQHHVTKRSSDSQVQFQFVAFERTFKMRLKRDALPFHRTVTMEIGNRRLNYDTSRAYTGILEDVPSKIHGVITAEGHFEGKVKVINETFFIERSKYHFRFRPDFHSVIYRLSDVTFDSNHAFCNMEGLHRKQLQLQKNWTRSAMEGNRQQEKWNERYTKPDHQGYHDDTDHHRNSRRRRATDPAKVMCEMYLQADHLYYQKYGSDPDTVIEKLTQHVQAINNMYMPVDFDGDGNSDNIAFIIKKIKIHDDPTASDYRYPGNYGVETFLNLHSEENYDEFCLSYIFTYRDFENGVLGLAWVGDTEAAGGVCERFATFSGSEKSLNTGIVTVLNYGMDVPSAVSHVTFGHEVGHNLGSPHDDDNNDECTPGNSAGNYIMYARATSGDKPNNDKLSSCSISSISPVLQAKARDTNGCFVEQQSSICGNRVVEQGEDCDCGWDDECTEGCCNPQMSNPAETPCTRKSTANCSPSEGPCCSVNCQYYNTSDSHVCRADSSCQEQVICDGSGAACPDSVAKANATSCGQNQVCYNGECSGKVCQAHGRTACQCVPATSGNWKDPFLCQVCCIADDGVCKSSFELDDIPDIKSLAGSPCNDFGGYCDVFHICREVDPSGPLSNLKKLIFSGEAIETLKVFLTNNWYIGVIVGVSLIVIIALVVKFCSKTHKPPSLDFSQKPRSSGGRGNQVSPDRWM